MLLVKVWVGREYKIDDIRDKRSNDWDQIDIFGKQTKKGENKRDSNRCAKTPCYATDEVIEKDFMER